MIRVVIGVIGNDIHNVAIKLIEIALTESGFSVYNLGVNTKPVEFVDAVVETKADLLMISSLNGEAATWAYNIKEMLKERSVHHCLLAIGGNLSIGESDEQEIVERFKNYGYDFVFYQKEIEESISVIKDHLSLIQK